MIPKISLSLLFLFFFSPTWAQQQSPAPILFYYAGKYVPPSENKIVSGGTKLSLNRDLLNQLYHSRNTSVAVKLQLENEVLVLQLKRADLFSYNRPEVVMASHFKAFQYTPGYYLQGTIEGQAKSVVALSIFENFAGGIISYGGNNYTIGVANPGNDVNTDEYIIYSDKEYHAPLPGCATSVENRPLPVLRDMPLGGNTIGCSVDVYFELGFEMYFQFGGNTQSLMNYFTLLFNAVQTLYNNETILMQIREVKIWDTPEPENNFTGSSSALYSFSSRMQFGFNGDLAHYVTFNNLGGGVAWRDVLCGSRYYATGVSGNLRVNYSPFPAYSFSVNVITHETGHNIGSPHTHSCSWPGGPIDGCYPVDAGPCIAGPIPPAGGGTIMSYCHLRPAVGVNFANGFGPLPGNLVRTKVTAASTSSCLCSCSDITLDITTQDIGCGTPSGSATPVITHGTGPFTFLWSNGSTDSVATGLAAGTYYVKVTGANGTCTVIKGCKINSAGNALTVTVTPSTAAVSKCINETHLMTVSVNPSGTYNYQWYNNNAAIPGATNASYTATASGVYYASVTNGTCVGRSSSVNVTIQNIPPFNITVNGAADICLNDSVRLSVPVSSYAVEWRLNGNLLPGANSTSYFAHAAGNYTAKLFSLSNPACNSISAPVAIQVKPSPQAVVSPAGNISFCEGDKVVLTHTPAAGTTFKWLRSAAPIAGATQSSYTVSSSGIYSLSVTGANGCTTVSAATNVIVNPLPDSILLPAGMVELCSGGTQKLFVNNPGIDYSYRWYNNQQQVSVGNTGTISVTAGGKYSVVITDNFTGCSSTSDTTLIKIIPPPVIFAGNDTVLSTGQPYQMRARELSTLGVNRFEWSPSTGLNNPFIANPVTVLNADQLYVVKGIHPSGCFGTDSVLIKVFKGPAIYVPTAFSPNGDGLNDILRCIAVGLNSFKYFDVYNRLGERMFRTTNPSVGWDGTYKGAPVDSGAYVWIAEGVNFRGEPMLVRGTVVILR